MKKLSLVFLCLIFLSFKALSFEGLLKNYKEKIILGMVLLEDTTSTFEIQNVVKDLEKNWKLEVKGEILKTPEPTILEIEKYTIAIAYFPFAVPKEEIIATAEYNYFWEDGVQEAPKHKGHILVSIINGGENPIKENILFNKVVSSVLNHSNSIGVYLGERSLLLNKEFYLANTEMLHGEELPIYTWIYFGMRSEKNRNSVYTYGLKDFGKEEMEIVNSKKDGEKIFEMIYDITFYVLAYDVTLKDGETIGGSSSQKLKISFSKGKFLEGKTLKIKY